MVENTSTSFPIEKIQEGKVQVIVPKLAAFKKSPADYAPSKPPVFYNPVMELNRDISVLAFKTYQRIVGREITICDPLTSSGIRGIRYAVEIPSIKKVVISDINQQAFNLAEQNVAINELQRIVELEHKDASCLLSCHGAPHKRFNIIDIDPFGSPVPYLDSSIRALRNKGILAATATDLAPLCGVHAKACLRRYGGKPLRTEYCQEIAVRLLAGCITAIAAKQEIGVKIVFSHSSNHYIRLYAEIDYGAKKADESIKNQGYIKHCFNCLHRELTGDLFDGNTSECPKCSSKLSYAGPLWLGRILDQSFCDEIILENQHVALKNGAKIAELFKLLRIEAKAPPTYYVIDHICDKLSMPVPSTDNVLLCLQENGFEAFPTHFNSRGVKTNAPSSVVQELVKDLSSKL